MRGLLCGYRRLSAARVGVLAVLIVPALLIAIPSQAPVAQGAATEGFVGMISPDTFAGNSRYRTAELASMKSSGVTLLRQVFDWSVIEQHPGKYDFTAYNSFVAAAARYGIEMMPILFNPPTWLSARPRHNHQHGTYPPENPASIEGLARAAVKWYGPNGGFWKAHPNIPKMPIRVWQVWDEPNLPVYWLPKPNAGQYTSLLRDAYRAIHGVDPDAEVVSAGIPQSALGVNLFTYLRSLLAAGAGRWMNTLGVNAYSKNAADMVTMLRQVRRTLNQNGASRVAIRVTEFGWANDGVDGHFSLTSSGQAEQIGDVVRDFGTLQSQIDMRGFVYFAWRDARPYPGGIDFWGLHTGLLTLRGLPKPALQAFVQAARSL